MIKATLKTLKEADDFIKVAKRNDFPITIHNHDYVKRYELCSINWCDAAQGDRPGGGSTGGQVHGMAKHKEITKTEWTPVRLIGSNTSNLHRVAKSSLAEEIQSTGVTDDESYLIRLTWGEINGVNQGEVDSTTSQTPCVLVTDAKALYDASLKQQLSGIELIAIKENIKRNNITLRWVSSGAMLADPMTKGKMRHTPERLLKNPSWKIVDGSELEGFKKCTLKGQGALDFL